MRSGARQALILALAPALSSVLLGGCGEDEDPDPASTTPKKKTTVMLMRHCPRSTYEDGVFGDDANLKYYNNYSAQSWPPFDVPAFHCTASGKKLVEKQAEWLKKEGGLPLPVAVVADNCSRDIVTGKALLRGLEIGVDENSFKVDHGPFIHGREADAAACPVHTYAEVDAAIHAQLARFPEKASFAALKATILTAAGLGEAGDWTNSSCRQADDWSAHWWAPLVGSCQVAHVFGERMLMEWAGDQTVGWGNLAEVATLIPKLNELSSWYLTVALYAPELQKKDSASIAWAILEALEAGEQGTKVFAGHDTNQGGLGAVLGLKWDPKPWPMTATLPASALRFDREGDSDEVKMYFVFADDFSPEGAGSMKSVPASIPDFEVGTVSLKALRGLVEKNTVAACRAKSPSAATAAAMVV